MQASGSATLDFAGETLLPAAKVHIASLELANALPAYVQPFLINSGFKDITGSGTIRGDVEMDAGLPVRAGLDLDAIAIESKTASVSLEGVGGRVNWFDDTSRTALAGTIDDDLFQSSLAWKAGQLWGLELGPASLPFTTTGRQLPADSSR